MFSTRQQSSTLLSNNLSRLHRYYYGSRCLLPNARTQHQLIRDETPHYYYFIEKDESKALRVLDKIHISL
jgi:hypothetical protein